MLMVSVSCDDENCDAYEEVTASLSDGVSAIETETAGWQMGESEQFCPAHRDSHDPSDEPSEDV